ncbi:MAG: hypothetical protein CSB34_01255 [Desulfobulbus propionicus]|nr:MAG: hypothetical protein CSB34_01255 [Desulfobulbus propionicus]
MACDAYSVVVTDVGTSTTQTARMIRMLTGLEPRVHNDGIASLPVTIAERLSREEAQRFKLRLQSVGTRVRLECSTTSSVAALDDAMKTVDSLPPVISIAADSSLSLTMGDTIRLRVRAEDDTHVAEITLFADGNIIKTCTGQDECWYEEKMLEAGSVSYMAQAVDNSGNMGVSSILKARVFSSTKSGPLLNSRTIPLEPTETETVRFVVSGFHASGIEAINIQVNGVEVATCNGVETCEYLGGPYPLGNLVWRASAISVDGERTYTIKKKVTIAPGVVEGKCTLSGTGSGPNADLASAFFINLFGPDDLQEYRETVSFRPNGEYRFSGLPEGRYQLVVDTRGDMETFADPPSLITTCQGTGVNEVNFTFP